MNHAYSDTFINYIDGGLRNSAMAFCKVLMEWLNPQSVLDLGCGRGVWLDEWQKAGVRQILGMDGDSVNRAQLAMEPGSFQIADLTRPLRLTRRFDLAQSLELGEHLPKDAADVLIDNLTAASDCVLFSAAVVGQGGECHINEQPLSFWQAKFEARGYRAYDCLRPVLKDNRQVQPWYRYNAVLYVNQVGTGNLPDAVLRHAVPKGHQLRNGGDLMWRLRRGILSHLPQRIVTQIAQTRAAILAARAHRQLRAEG